METPDYGYYNDEEDHISSYVFNKLVVLLGDRKNSILDIGCGNGWMGKRLLNKGFNYYGIDASVKGIEIAQRIAPDRFFIHDVNDLELNNSIRKIKFQTIISTEVIEHLYDPNDFIKLCKSILMNNGGGELIISTPYHGYIKNLALAISGKMDNHFTALWHGGHIKFFSKKSLTALLLNNGFEIVSFTGCGRIPFLWKSMLIKAKI